MEMILNIDLIAVNIDIDWIKYCGGPDSHLCNNLYYE